MSYYVIKQGASYMKVVSIEQRRQLVPRSMPKLASLFHTEKHARDVALGFGCKPENFSIEEVP